LKLSPWLVASLAVICVHLACLAPQNTRAQDAATNSEEVAPVERWRSTGAMAVRREYAGGVRLKDGRILAVSGHPLGGRSIASAELYDPKTKEWTDTGSLRQPRNSGNAATLLPDGRVLVAGGHSKSKAIRGSELFDPVASKWSDTGNLSVGRDPVATLLADGRVLAAGGIDWYSDSGRKVYDLAEIYDSKRGKWTTTGSLHTARSNHRSERLDDGRVLAVGGYGQRGAPLASAELFDPSTGKWQTTDRLALPRAWFGLVKLLDGRVLVVGGYTGSSSMRTYLASAAIYDAKRGRWSETRPMTAKRAGFSITLLADGRVLVAGGVAETGDELDSAELFDPRADSWRPIAPMIVARRNHRAALLPDGGVLVMGGSILFGNNYLNSCEILTLR